MLTLPFQSFLAKFQKAGRALLRLLVQPISRVFPWKSSSRSCRKKGAKDNRETGKIYIAAWIALESSSSSSSKR